MAEQTELPSLTEWMGAIDDATSIIELRGIPGTHNSAAIAPRYPYTQWAAWPWAKCQTASIQEQLEMGVRYFDLRLRSLPTCGTIVISHTLAAACSFEDVILAFKRFLDAHPSEVVLCVMKRDWNHRREWRCAENASSNAVWTTLASVLGERGLPPSDCPGAVTISALRGRVLPILHDDALRATNRAVRRWTVAEAHARTWDCGAMSTAREILVGSATRGYAAEMRRRKLLVRHETNVLLVKGVVLPCDVARPMNQWLLRELAPRGALESADFGVLCVDFIDRTLARSIVALNAAHLEASACDR
jgi:hypothetical protein